MDEMVMQKPPLGVGLDWSNPLNKDLVMHLAMNEGHGDKVQDLSMNGNHGTLGGFSFPSTPVSGWNPGRTGVGLKFDGTDDYIDCGNNTSLAITDEITISMWIHRDTDSGTYERLLFKNGVADYYVQISDTDKFIFRIGGLDAVSSLIDIKIGEWVLATAKYDGAFSKIFLDGVFDNSVSNAGAIPTSAGNLEIGRFGSYKFNGSIDQVRIYSRALTAKEVQDYYTNPWQVYQQ